ncbi:head-tail connector protein [Lactococcus lactis]|uniref:Phage protein n=1 Tax=Lactococcus lactis TaxID=1358 RepID=A0AAW5TSB4_9LACT|nr:hypothetical protein [Lactococcus lactis]MCW2281416.1 hypothetical protein [Lactococcus lactis]MCW2281444.1 hypothetical protein [Lactococcus lactis]MCW2282178.1 hypothetical protein [Lactococcus lactis]
MPYLDYKQYTDMNFSKVPKDKFDELEKYAEIYLDQITMDYYQLHDIENDTDLYRVSHFRKAVALVVDYLHSADATTFSELNRNSPNTVSVGRMNLSFQNTNTGTIGKTMIPIEAYRILFRTGLLYRGEDGL